MKRTLFTLALLLMLSVSAFAQSVPSLMNFQGRLAKPDGTPVPDNASQPVTFNIYSTATGGTALWSQTSNVAVSNGVFAVAFNFSAGFATGQSLSTVFNGATVYLETQVGSNTPLTPRQPFASHAYAFLANSAFGVANGSITDASIASATITADKFASGIFNPLVWLLGGNSGTYGTQFLGTTDNEPLIFKVNGQQAMRYAYAANASYQSINVLGGSAINSIAGGVVGATIAGGGQQLNTTSYPNTVTADFGTVSGGYGNQAATVATVGGGYQNTASGGVATVAGGQSNFASNEYASVGGGAFNTASGSITTVGGGYQNTANGSGATVGGGYQNTASNPDATVGGGYQNMAIGNTSTVAGGQGNSASSLYATIGGGYNNTASNQDATVGGGQANMASGTGATVVGGYDNTASNEYATVGGGYNNAAAGAYSFAAGQQASVRSTDSGSFVWNDDANGTFSSTGTNQFLIHAFGGVGINTNTPLQALSVMGGLVIDQGAQNGGALNNGQSTGFGLSFGSYTGGTAASGEGIASNRTTSVNQYGLDFYTNSANRMSITNSGNVGIGTTAPQYTLDVNGGGNFRNGVVGNSPSGDGVAGTSSIGVGVYGNGAIGIYGASGSGSAGYFAGNVVYTGTLTHSSDARYKKNVATLNNALDDVLNLRGVTYNFDREKWTAKHFPEGKQIGFIAQEIEKIFPELVSTDAKGYKSVNYIGVVPVLVEAMKTQQKQLDDQKRQIDALKAQVREIETLKKQNAEIGALIKKLLEERK